MGTTVPESLIRVFPAWAYCQLWLSNTAMVKNQNQRWASPKTRPEPDPESISEIKLGERLPIRTQFYVSQTPIVWPVGRLADRRETIYSANAPATPLGCRKPKGLPALPSPTGFSSPQIHVTAPPPQTMI